MPGEGMVKGKLKEKGNWIVGWEAEDPQTGKNYILVFGNGENKNISAGRELPNYHLYEVDPNTICKYVGPVGANEVCLWEGDVFEFENSTYFVRWNEMSLEWDAGVVSKLPEASFFKLAQFRFENIRLVGNIYDNPGLLEAKTKENKIQSAIGIIENILEDGACVCAADKETALNLAVYALEEMLGALETDFYATLSELPDNHVDF